MLGDVTQPLCGGDGVVPCYVTTIFCLACPLLGFVFALIYARATAKINLDPSKYEKDVSAPLMGTGEASSQELAKVYKIYQLIYDGAHAFLWAEYRVISYFVVGFAVVILCVLGGTIEDKSNSSWVDGALTAAAFVLGCLTSVIAGYLGMKIGVFANARTAIRSQVSLNDGFVTAFKAAIVMGFCLCSLGILNIFILINFYWLQYKLGYRSGDEALDHERVKMMFEAIAGYGLGGSCIGLFGRVGGGIYTKAADVGADLVGKIEAGIPEDDPRNPAVIADNVGDNVGDIAGMGADLFGSFAEATCAALVIGSQSDMYTNWTALSFPIVLSCAGIVVCFITSFFATHFGAITETNQIEPRLKRQLLISTVLMTPVMLGLCYLFLPSEIRWFVTLKTTAIDPTPCLDATIDPEKCLVRVVQNWHVFFACASGLWSGLIIGYVTEYYTSHRWGPTREVAASCKTGSATNIIYGLALGYKSTIIPCIVLAVAIYVSHSLASYYGVACAALGILSTLSIGLTIDAFGPICDNAGGIAEMADLGDEVRDRTDALDAAGNTTAAIGKGFAIGSAAFVSLALFSGFVNVAGITTEGINILNPWPFSGLLVGAMLPYWFSAMTMKSVGHAALAMVEEVREQFRNNPGILEGTVEPNYERCIRISTDASLKEMIPPGALVMLTPLIVGFLFGVQCLAGVLAGALVSGVQMAISSSNTGGAWDNAKKYIEAGALGAHQGKGSEVHKAAVVGDTVGDPLKDTSGPALNILIKLMAIISLVFGRSFPTCEGGYIGKLFGAECPPRV